MLTRLEETPLQFVVFPAMGFPQSSGLIARASLHALDRLETPLLLISYRLSRFWEAIFNHRHHHKLSCASFTHFVHWPFGQPAAANTPAI
jgi:hypothetical protein